MVKRTLYFVYTGALGYLVLLWMSDSLMRMAKHGIGGDDITTILAMIAVPLLYIEITMRKLDEKSETTE